MQSVSWLYQKIVKSADEIDAAKMDGSNMEEVLPFEIDAAAPVTADSGEGASNRFIFNFFIN